MLVGALAEAAVTSEALAYPEGMLKIVQIIIKNSFNLGLIILFELLLKRFNFIINSDGYLLNLIFCHRNLAFGLFNFSFFGSHNLRYFRVEYSVSYFFCEILRFAPLENLNYFGPICWRLGERNGTVYQAAVGS